MTSATRRIRCSTFNNWRVSCVQMCHSRPTGVISRLPVTQALPHFSMLGRLVGSAWTISRTKGSIDSKARFVSTLSTSRSILGLEHKPTNLYEVVLERISEVNFRRVRRKLISEFPWGSSLMDRFTGRVQFRSKSTSGDLECT